MTPEGKVQQRITQYLKKNNHFYFKIQSSSINGIPDIFAIINKTPIFIEVKSAKGRLSPLQEYQIKRIRDNGIRVWVCYSFEEFLEELIILDD